MASKTLRAKYPRQLTIMLSDEVADRIEQVAEIGEVSKGEAARFFLEAGIAAEEGDG